MTTTVYAIVLTFASWDACWAFWDKNSAELHANATTHEMCQPYRAEETTSAPVTSLRPRARPSVSE